MTNLNLCLGNKILLLSMAFAIPGMAVADEQYEALKKYARLSESGVSNGNASQGRQSFT